jgi:hypothetical protein
MINRVEDRPRRFAHYFATFSSRFDVGAWQSRGHGSTGRARATDKLTRVPAQARLLLP